MELEIAMDSSEDPEDAELMQVEDGSPMIDPPSEPKEVCFCLIIIASLSLWKNCINKH